MIHICVYQFPAAPPCIPCWQHAFNQHVLTFLSISGPHIRLSYCHPNIVVKTRSGHHRQDRRTVEE